MAELAALGTAIAAGVGEIGIGTAIAAGSAVAGGIAANDAAQSQAKALRQKADFDEEQGKRRAADEMAKGTRLAAEQRQRNEKVVGRAKALLADSGAGGGEGATATLEDLFNEGDYLATQRVRAAQSTAAGALDAGNFSAYSSRVAANNAEAQGKAGLIKAGLGAASSVVGNRYKLGVGFSADDDLEEPLYNDGWETTARRTARRG